MKQTPSRLRKSEFVGLGRWFLGRTNGLGGSRKSTLVLAHVVTGLLLLLSLKLSVNWLLAYASVRERT